MSAIKKLVGPVALTTTLTTNVFNPSSALIDAIVNHIHVVNKTAAAATFSLWLGASGGNAAGTELFNGESVPANRGVDFYFSPGLRMTSADFLVGGSNTATALTIIVMGQQVIV